MALGTGSAPHSGGRKGCSISPGCGIFWGKNSRIAKVLILAGNHPEVGKEVWSCYHHSQASIGGFQLQTQLMVPRMSGEASKSSREVSRSSAEASKSSAEASKSSTEASKSSAEASKSSGEASKDSGVILKRRNRLSLKRKAKDAGSEK